MKTVLLVLAIVTGLAVLWLALLPPARTQTSRQSPVVLVAAPGNARVQMFDRATVDARVIATFAGGLECSRFGGPSTTTIDGVTMSFVRLTCSGVTGYVNTKWVR